MLCRWCGLAFLSSLPWFKCFFHGFSFQRSLIFIMVDVLPSHYHQVSGDRPSYYLQRCIGHGLAGQYHPHKHVSLHLPKRLSILSEPIHFNYDSTWYNKSICHLCWRPPTQQLIGVCPSYFCNHSVFLIADNTVCKRVRCYIVRQLSCVECISVIWFCMYWVCL